MILPRFHAGARRLLFRTLIAAAALLAMPLAFADDELGVRFELKEGDKVSDKVTVVAKVTGSENVGIEKVEFLLDDKPAGTDTSTPYTLEWDTLADNEGPHTIVATVFDAKGQTKRAKITLNVDNELSKGADFHADNALAALKEGNVDSAVKSARRALKVDPSNLKAARALAGIHRERREYPEAIAVMEKATIPDGEIGARADLVGLYILNGSASDSTEDFLKNAGKAIEVHKKLAAARAAKGGTGAIEKGDAQFAAHNWAGAVNYYQQAVSGLDTAPMENVNRLLLAYIYAGRIKDAESALGTVNRAKRGDELTRVVQSLLLYRKRDFAKAKDMIQEGADNGQVASLIMAGYIELAQGSVRKARDIAERAAKLAPDLPEVQMLRAYTVIDAIDASKAVTAALMVDPTLPEAYALKGFQALLGKDKSKYASADQLFDFALKRDPINNYALVGAALSLMAQKRPIEAEPLLEQLNKQDYNWADVHAARALNFSLADKSIKVEPEMALARKQDPDRFQDALVPNPAELTSRIYRYRYSPIITPGSLYPVKVTANRG